MGSQRKNGTCTEIEKHIRSHAEHSYDFIRMSDARIKGCLACEKCGHTGTCILSGTVNDDFEDILRRIIGSDVLLVITPIYAPYPSRLTAFMERILSISYFGSLRGIPRPLKGKRTGIICYGSSKIEDDTQLKILFQKYLMDDYSFDRVDYAYINDARDPNAEYGSVVAYVDAVVSKLG